MVGRGSSAKNWSETVVFTLAKYSRCGPRRPLNSVPQSGVPASAPLPPVSSAEWSHFSQPRLSLIVETIHSDSEGTNRLGDRVFNRDQKIILKIIWDNNPQPSSSAKSSVHHSTDTAGVFVLEQVNLSEVVEDFSHSRLGEVPLKAVCKDSVVGIRYATAHQVGSLIFNRFQVRFQKPDDCLKFLASIEAVCPCRMSGVSQDSQDSSQLPTENIYSAGKRGSTLGILGSIVTPCPPTRMRPPLQAGMLASATPARDHNEHIQQNTIAPCIPEEISTRSAKSVARTAEEFVTVPPQECQGPTLDRMQSHGHNQFESRKQLQPFITPPITPSIDPARPSHLDDVSDEILQGYIREMALEPGFGDFVKRVKRLLPHS